MEPKVRANGEGIIVLSPDNEPEDFEWLSDNWNRIDQRHTKKAQQLWQLAHEQILAGENVPDVIERLKAVGFNVTREETPTQAAQRRIDEGDQFEIYMREAGINPVD